MGTDKARLEVGGASIATRIAEVLRGVGSRRISFVKARDSKATSPEGLPVVQDIYPDRGAPGGIHAALSDCSTKAAFIAACDLPFVSSDLAALLVREYESGIFDCVVSEQADGMVQPLFGIYSREPCLSRSEEVLTREKGGRSAQALLNAVRTRIVPFEAYAGLAGAELLLLNVNTPEDLDRARRIADAL